MLPLILCGSITPWNSRIDKGPFVPSTPTKLRQLRLTRPNNVEGGKAKNGKRDIAEFDQGTIVDPSIAI